MAKKSFIKKSLLIATINMLFSYSALTDDLPYQNDYAFGVDASFVEYHIEQGHKYYENGNEKSPWKIFTDHGYNWARVHLCNEPTEKLPQNLEYVIQSGRAIKQNGLHFMLDLMLSNSWANPMTQPMPSTSQDISHEARVDSMYEFCYNAISKLRQANATPDIVQIGNEISNGFLWPAARLYPLQDKKSNWSNLVDYIESASRGIKEGAGDKNVRIMVHVDHGGDIPLTRNFYDKIEEHEVDYDLIGFSFYPWSHGTLVDLKDNLRFTANRYKKEIILVETGYYFKTSRYFQDIKPPFPETPQGQKQWLKAVNVIVLNTPSGLGKGVFWWEPMMGGRGFFDKDGNVQPVIKALHKYAYPIQRADGQSRLHNNDK